MYNQKKNISIIIPFYYGNKYMETVLGSIEKCIEKNKDEINIEVLIVNDSPQEKVFVPKQFKSININVITNSYNMGIQKTRVNGVKKATGDWLIFLDQDDELLFEGFHNQIAMMENADVVVGNGFYQIQNKDVEIFNNYKQMKYLIQLNNFIEIRNLIPSPGECVIKKGVIPELWLEAPLKKNGADDWLLWILLFKSGARVKCNPELVYVHNDTNGNNLSADLGKMKESALEMYEVLVNNKILNYKEQKKLKNAIIFKYLQDTRQLTLLDLWKYRVTILLNVKYKIMAKILEVTC